MAQDMPLMPKATAVWLVESTALTFDQIANFCGLHPLEVKGIADGEVAAGIRGRDPILNAELTREEIEKGEADTDYELQIMSRRKVAVEKKRSAPRYTPVSRRQDRPNAILWMVRNHPEISDAQISRLVGTTKPTIVAIRDKTHWNYNNLKPTDPVSLGLTTQIDLDAAVMKAAKRRGNVPDADSPTLQPASATIAEPREPEPKKEDHSAAAVFAQFSSTDDNDDEKKDD